ncbi:MAG: hypothetical protein ACTSXQ_06275 [Alphaproteobacteria bacterium]
MNKSKKNEIGEILAWGLLKLLAKINEEERVIRELLLDLPAPPSMYGKTNNHTETPND